MSTTAGTIITGALQLIGAIAAEETPSAVLMQDGLRRLNLMMGQWGLSNFTIPAQARQVFPLIANKGGPANPYTLGPTGNFVMAARPLTIAYAALLLNASAPPVERTLAIYTDDSYNEIPVKDLPNVQPTGIYYEPTFAGGLGTLNLWPVPTTALNSLVLYWYQPLGLFASLTASYDLPPGADEPVEYNLAVRLAPVYSKPLTPDLLGLASISLSAYKRSNVSMSDQAQDFTPNARTSYNIFTGTGG